RRLAKDSENLAETLATFVTLASIRWVPGGSPGRWRELNKPLAGDARRSAHRIVKGPSSRRPATTRMRRKPTLGWYRFDRSDRPEATVHRPPVTHERDSAERYSITSSAMSRKPARASGRHGAPLA